MIRLNRTTEYGLIALSHIRLKDQGGITSAREIADQFKLPFEILAKTLQKLKENEFIHSTHGTKGGYVLSRNLKQVTLAEFITAMEGDMDVVCCVSKESKKSNCPYFNLCNIKPAMTNLNARLTGFMSSITLDELTTSTAIAAEVMS